METEIIEVGTGSREGVFDITGECQRFVANAVRAAGSSAAGSSAAGSSSNGDMGDGLLNVFVPHATAGLAIMELGSGSDPDLLAVLAEVLPADDRWQHAHGSRGHGRSHVMPAFLPPYATIPVVGGRLALGTWQSVALVDLNVDNHTRQVRLSYLT
jgi:secondary thiamine-phosphate synthase enzyme